MWRQRCAVNGAIGFSLPCWHITFGQCQLSPASFPSLQLPQRFVALSYRRRTSIKEVILFVQMKYPPHTMGSPHSCVIAGTATKRMNTRVVIHGVSGKSGIVEAVSKSHFQATCTHARPLCTLIYQNSQPHSALYVMHRNIETEKHNPEAACFRNDKAY